MKFELKGIEPSNTTMTTTAMEAQERGYHASDITRIDITVNGKEQDYAEWLRVYLPTVFQNAQIDVEIGIEETKKVSIGDSELSPNFPYYDDLPTELVNAWDTYHSQSQS